MIEKYKVGEIVKYIRDSAFYGNGFIKILEINNIYNCYYDCYYVETLNYGVRFYTPENTIRKLTTEEKLELL